MTFNLSEDKDFIYRLQLGQVDFSVHDSFIVSGHLMELHLRFQQSLQVLKKMRLSLKGKMSCGGEMQQLF